MGPRVYDIGVSRRNNFFPGFTNTSPGEILPVYIALCHLDLLRGGRDIVNHTMRSLCTSASENNSRHYENRAIRQQGDLGIQCRCECNDLRLLLFLGLRCKYCPSSSAAALHRLYPLHHLPCGLPHIHTRLPYNGSWNDFRRQTVEDVPYCVRIGHRSRPFHHSRFLENDC